MKQAGLTDAVAPLPVRRKISRHDSTSAPDVPADALAADLRTVVAGEVRFDRGSRALYATDASNYRQLPLGVILPRDEADVTAALAVLRRYGVPLFARGAGTSLAGQTCNTGVVFEFSKYMHRILELDPEAGTARVQPGVVLDSLRGAAARHGLTFGPDPATHRYCTLGGMIGNNSCGVHSVMAEFHGPGPTTGDSIESLEILTADGTRLRVGATDDGEFQRVLATGGRAADIFRHLRTFQQKYEHVIRRDFPDIPRRVSGYNLPWLLPEAGFHIARALVGSEATLALVLEATVRLIPSRPHRVLVVLGYTDVFTAADHVPEVRTHRPVGIEGMDAGLVEDLHRIDIPQQHFDLLPEGRGWLLVEFGAGTAAEARELARAFADDMRTSSMRPSVAVFEDAQDQEHLWEIRESGLAATARVAGRHPTWPGWEDSAVPPERFGAYLRDFQKLLDRYGYRAALYGHFGQGCLHCRIDFELRTAEGIASFRAFMEAAADLVRRYGGSLSGEHGDGQARGELLERLFGPDLVSAFREFKAIWDPEGRMNPGKVVDARPLDADLRLGTSYDPPPVDSWFRFPDDLGSFAHATLRCVGVGKCRKTDAGTMCPSYMVTGEEKHTTRGRAQLLFEMLEGDPLEMGWQSEAVHEALDLCLSCKGCKGECPVQVDMATYKAEFLAHYHEHHRRPRTAYAFGHVRTWARLVSRFHLAPLVNTAAALPGVSRLAKLAAGMPPERDIPAFAPRTFREWFLARPPRPRGGRRAVILWPDTFNDHFHPETLQAAVDVLEGLDLHVVIPRAPLCCGRPLYDFGMLSTAKRRLEEIMEALSAEIRDGVSIVGLEPSCVSVLRDELVNLFPASDQAHRLKAQTLTLAEFLDRQERLPPWRLERRRWCTDTATTKRSWALTPIGVPSSGSDCGSRCSTPAAAGWRGRSGSRRGTSTSRWRWGSGCSCRRCAPLRGQPRHCRWIQLPGTDRTGDRSAGDAPGAGAPDGTAGRPARARRRPAGAHLRHRSLAGPLFGTRAGGGGARRRGAGHHGRLAPSDRFLNPSFGMSTPSAPDKDPKKPHDEPAERDRDWNEDVPPTPPTEPEPVPVQEPPDSPGKQRGPYIAG